MSNRPPPAHYIVALELAMDLMEKAPGLEPTSAIRQAGRDTGIPFGTEMQDFCTWAKDQLEECR